MGYLGAQIDPEVLLNLEENGLEIADPVGRCTARATEFDALVSSKSACTEQTYPTYAAPYPPNPMAFHPFVIDVRARAAEQSAAHAAQIASYQQLKLHWPFWLGAIAVITGVAVMAIKR